MKCAVIVFPGTNRERDMMLALAAAGARRAVGRAGESGLLFTGRNPFREVVSLNVF